MLVLVEFASETLPLSQAVLCMCVCVLYPLFLDSFLLQDLLSRNGEERVSDLKVLVVYFDEKSTASTN